MRDAQQPSAAPEDPGPQTSAVGWPTRIAFGLGSLAEGIKNGAFKDRSPDDRQKLEQMTDSTGVNGSD